MDTDVWARGGEGTSAYGYTHALRATRHVTRRAHQGRTVEQTALGLAEGLKHGESRWLDVCSSVVRVILSRVIVSARWWTIEARPSSAWYRVFGVAATVKPTLHRESSIALNLREAAEVWKLTKLFVRALKEISWRRGEHENVNYGTCPINFF